LAKKRVLIIIDQATRDGLSQLLTARYLEKKGVEVIIANQGTLRAKIEAFKPQVLYLSWWTNPGWENFIRAMRHRTRIVLIDQEGGRMGEASFRRSVLRHNAIKLIYAQSATRVVAWGTSQRKWLVDLGVDPKKIVVTGCARLDPYLLPSEEKRRYFGVTLRADPLTSGIEFIMENMHHTMFRNPEDGLAPSQPMWAEYEDWMWTILATTRHMFKAIIELRKKTKTQVVVRPGPWERWKMYQFLEKKYENVQINPWMMQHRYVQGSHATIDASSAMGLESLLAGTPVISTTSLIPRIEEHAGGADGARLNAPYRNFYWQPKSIEELVDLALKAEKGQLRATADATGMEEYLRDCHGWPTPKPASFRVGDLLLEMLDSTEPFLPRDKAAESFSFKNVLYRNVPGLHNVPEAKMRWNLLTANDFDRQHLERYHYLDSRYPHHPEVARVFEGLWARYGHVPAVPQP
jgi:surface carbohydrate biosynthesis protein